MKKILVVLVALALAVPAVSYAGSATSRWDLTIGGFVKFDYAYGTQGVGTDYSGAVRRSGYNATGQVQSIRDEYSYAYMASGQTLMNFLVRGPETMGAKTTAYVEGDWRGHTVSGTTNVSNDLGTYGTFTLRIAYAKFDWTNDSLRIGQWWSEWGWQPSFALLGFSDIGGMNKSTRQPQITWYHTFTKNWSTMLTLYNNYNTLASSVSATSTAMVDNDFSRGNIPYIGGELRWNTDACGRVGNWNLQFAAGGAWTNQKATYNTGTQANPAFSDKDVDSWMATFKGVIPIIPERAPGQPGGGLYVSFQGFTAQNMGSLIVGGGSAPATWAQNLSTTGINSNGTIRYVAPVGVGGWANFVHFITDKLWWSGTFARSYWNESSAYKAANPNATQNISNYYVSFFYDVNPAVRFGFQASRVYTKFAGYGTNTTLPTSGTGYLSSPNQAGLNNYGQVDMVRVAAWYFF